MRSAVACLLSVQLNCAKLPIPICFVSSEDIRWIAELGNRIRLMWLLKYQNWPSFPLDRVFSTLHWYGLELRFYWPILNYTHVTSSHNANVLYIFFQWVSTKSNFNSVVTSRIVATTIVAAINAVVVAAAAVCCCFYFIAPFYHESAILLWSIVKLFIRCSVLYLLDSFRTIRFSSAFEVSWVFNINQILLTF